jgi:hypothetical protein
MKKSTEQKSVLGKPILVTDADEFQAQTGYDKSPEYKGALIYPNGGYIFALEDGNYELMLDRSQYTDSDLPKLERLLAEWLEAERGE